MSCIKAGMYIPLEHIFRQGSTPFFYRERTMSTPSTQERMHSTPSKEVGKKKNIKEFFVLIQWTHPWLDYLESTKRGQKRSVRSMPKPGNVIPKPGIWVFQKLVSPDGPTLN